MVLLAAAISDVADPAPARIRGRWAELAKTQRQHRIARCSRSTRSSGQAQLVELLAAEGVVATQAHGVEGPRRDGRGEGPHGRR